ncbi:LL-diaminopimelate aminotransferase [candidate division WOR-1 bacterium RIFOXYA12_FULL_43_27]|uniref:LL-diaminopimelate aminotransferase n=1 Tax=candidate division WOR-1 bacterium RIFOXYC2_FULL_46_14 TaxID=1802587 RepID=A0A1F4U6S6_UNCSA|nr:MAG: LL-diaminopimelate aminotransferase [candidate division WOR-1 bacterium RIFOXYA12_FULL_43_27]OGC19557.1 MAG: LL-diaminopimelate aminotransferase [candidate division WOR-1 bacterium RIFOXYB2_FULL_46_45]OGC30545.1 MAG: LL-diaminopimelate aminotransferase [candidate division WOR-1 bacterium RIFOXYA2_FULL_46_56]OGC40612.1 MAG: LL-diaminopimelate aminotransferase [candidate division WOR-1 bacterium RIFOXYC2_FULL_46_14]
MEEAQRLKNLPPYVFAELDRLKAIEYKKGADLIDLGMGNPDVPPPPEVIEALISAIREPSNSRYPTFDGCDEFRAAVVSWCKKQYGIKVDFESGIIPLIGSKEGLVHFALAFVNPGDMTLVPMPAYPAHFRGTILAGGEPYVLPTSSGTGFLPNLDEIDPEVARKAKILFLSYPTNPTAATADRAFFEKAVAFAKKHKIILVHDFAYAEIYFEGKKPISCLSIPGAEEVCIEFHTLSKTFGMAGWRVGFVVGNLKLIATLKKIKTNLDYGLFSAVQKAAVCAMNLSGDYLERTRRIYQERRDIMVDGLNKLGCKTQKPSASMYVWVPVPSGFDSTSFSMRLLEKTGIVVAPGPAFGDLGEGYVRFALVDSKERISAALSRMEKAGIRWS